MKKETSVSTPVEAPGCYSHASVFSHRNPICKACPVYSECSGQVEAKLKAFAVHVDVSDHLRRHRNGNIEAGIVGENLQMAEVDVRDVPKREQRIARVRRTLTTEEEAMIAVLPKKVQIEAKKFIANEEHKTVLPALREGKNPYPLEGKRYLHVACAELLSGGFTKASLREAYMSKLTWTKVTAFSHVSMLLSLFNAFGIIEETKAGFVIKPQ